MTGQTHHDRPFPYTKSRSNQQLQQLRDEGPQLSSELPSGPRFSHVAGQFVGSIDPPWAGSEAVWYLWGDERRAVRRFVDEYEDQVREAMDKKNSTLSTRMSDEMWRLLCEEWMWGGYLTDTELERYKRRERQEDDDDE